VTTGNTDGDAALVMQTERQRPEAASAQVTGSI
jgi:hypothetical protein